jgi:hypothetical protein
MLPSQFHFFSEGNMEWNQSHEKTEQQFVTAYNENTRVQKWKPMY